MIIPLDPYLEGLAEKRFFSVALQIRDRQKMGDRHRISSIVKEEAVRAATLPDLNGQTDRYTACVRVLGDLAQLRWEIVETGYGLELHSPRAHDDHVTTSEGVRQRKEAIRQELAPRLRQQFEDNGVRNFIRQMERPSGSVHQKSIRALIADGAELHSRLTPARRHAVGTAEREAALTEAVRPYLQLVEPGVRDKYTSIRLQDIWRYFRYSWSIPQTPIPGRKLLYLVRDGSHSSHAVIGIAALSNCAVQMLPRDQRIGWTTGSLVSALTALLATAHNRQSMEESDKFLKFQGIYRRWRPSVPDQGDITQSQKTELLHQVHGWLVECVTQAIGKIEQRGLVTSEEIAEPTEAVVDRLRRLSREFANHRHSVLAQTASSSVEEGKAIDDWHPYAPVDEVVLDLEAKHTTNKPVHDSRRMLIRKKRAFELARLIDAKLQLTSSRQRLTNPETVYTVLDREEIRTAVSTAMSAIKSQRIGTNILEITTCGAVAPYNRMLGGKLVALMLLSPQVAADYTRRYGSEPTIIRSQLKNERVVPDNTLVWISTTSLFSHGSSQYERLRLPAGVICPDQTEIRYHYVGHTTGYGTVQFSDETVRSVETVMRRERGFRDVNGVFGEGASPRLRKLRAGLVALGFNSELILLHHQERRIYCVPLFPGASAYLCGLEEKAPDYVLQPEQYVDASERIGDFWRRRWLARRLEHEASWEALRVSRSRLLSSDLSTPPSESASPSDELESRGDQSEAPDDADELRFWKNLAQAGPNAISEGLNEAHFLSLHLKTKLEDLLLDQARQDLSIVLTGNAGDGKTHLARALQRRLRSEADRFDFAFDATAIMNRDEGVLPIVKRWRNALRSGRSMILAVNQYPLYLLRQKLRSSLPKISREIERQWDERLVYSTNRTAHSSPARVILVDLSLRNPLAASFAGDALEHMLKSPALSRYAESGVDANFSWNYRRLIDSEIRRRLLALFERVISAGGRATVRELWILCARLLFGITDEPETAGAERAWYSERLFAPDVRFPLANLLRRYADPAGVTHPQVDRNLETQGGTSATDWRIDRELPEPVPARLAMANSPAHGRDKYLARFVAVKRRYYFEHVDGGESSVFKLDDRSHAEFHALLRNSFEDTLNLQNLIEAINRCYFPTEYEGMREKLYLWVGHRLDEQPTTSYVANEAVHRQRLQLRRPEPTSVFRGSFDYIEDHILLGVTLPEGDVNVDLSLRIDAELYASLVAIKQGLPRHLIDPGKLNRLDAFIDKLRGANPDLGSEFLIYNAEHVVSSVVHMTPAYASYEAVRRV